MAGIEVFGRGATVVEYAPRDQVPRTPALGSGSILLGVLAAIAFAAAVVERANRGSFEQVFTWVAMGGSVVAVFAGVVALLTGRGRLTGFIGILLGLGANPWVLGRVLEYLAELPSS